jgi:hypothetical protein
MTKTHLKNIKNNERWWRKNKRTRTLTRNNKITINKVGMLKSMLERHGKAPCWIGNFSFNQRGH